MVDVHVQIHTPTLWLIAWLYVFTAFLQAERTNFIINVKSAFSEGFYFNLFFFFLERLIRVCLVMLCLCVLFESDYSCVSPLPEQDKRVTLIQEKHQDERFWLQIRSFFPSVTGSFCNTSTSLACLYLFSPPVFRRVSAPLTR